MALTSTSTDADVIAQYEDNSRYWESSTKCQNFLEAIIFMLRRFPLSTSSNGVALSMTELQSLRKEVFEHYHENYDEDAGENTLIDLNTTYEG